MQSFFYHSHVHMENNLEDLKCVHDVLCFGVHSILYYRRVYPANTFGFEINWNVRVPKSLHEPLCEYVERYTMEAARFAIDGRLQEFIVQVSSTVSEYKELFVFRFQDIRNAYYEEGSREKLVRSLFEKLSTSTFGRPTEYDEYKPDSFCFKLFLKCTNIAEYDYEKEWSLENLTPGVENPMRSSIFEFNYNANNAIDFYTVFSENDIKYDQYILEK